MNLQQLYYFKTIAKYKNFTRASKDLLVAQSSLSHSISELEDELGVPLFYKVGRKTEITNFGIIYLEHVERIINEIELSKQKMQLLLNPNVGKIRLAFGNTLSNRFLPGIIKKFYENPDNKMVQFEFVENQVYKILEDFKYKRTDLGFGPKVDDIAIEFFPIIDEEMVAIVSNKHRLAKRKSINLNDLIDEPIICYSYNCGTRYYMDKIFEEAQIAPNIIQEVENEKMMASLVSADIGVGIMPLIPELDVYDVVTLQLNNSNLHRTLCMMWPKHEFMLPVVKNFRDFIIRLIQSN